MTSGIRPAGNSLLAIILALAAVALPATTVRAQSAEETPPEAPSAASAKEIKEQEKEARIQEYLRRKEERRARKQAETNAQEPRDLESAKELEQQQLAPPPVAPAPTPAVAAPAEAAAAPPVVETPPPVKPANQARKPAPLPRDLARAQAHVRALPLGQDPTVLTYLERIDRQDASPGQLAAFGSFLAQNGLLRDALAYYQVALQIEREDPLLWVNLGTLHRQMKEMSAARSAYERALGLDPNNAYAHYNLGAVLDEMGKYDSALAEYRAALSLDPSLGDPVQNPQAANNSLLAAVKLMQYRDQIGSLGLPLIEIPPDSGGGTAAAEK